MNHNVNTLRRRKLQNPSRQKQTDPAINVATDLLRQTRHANEADHLDLVPIAFTYGGDQPVTVTGAMFRDVANELVSSGLLVHRGRHALELPGSRDGSLSAEQVEYHIRGIEERSIKAGLIKDVRGERLDLTDTYDESKRSNYASYDRNLDILGFRVHSVSVVTHMANGPRRGALVVALRDPDLAHYKGDSSWDIVAGAIEHGATPQQTIVSEAYDEFGLNAEQMLRATPIGIVTTRRKRGEYGIVRDVMRVNALGLEQREAEALVCHDVKKLPYTRYDGVKDTRDVISNQAFLAVDPETMMDRLKKHTYLRNAKGLSVMRYLMTAGHFHPRDPSLSALEIGLAMPARGVWTTRSLVTTLEA